MQNQELTIIQVNDTHGYLEPHDELFYQGNHAEFETAGGWAKISTLINQKRHEKNGKVITLDCGDTIHGTYPTVKSKGEVLVPILNKIGFDAWTGHWEFGYGPDQLKKIIEKLNYPFLAINCYDIETGDLTFDPYKIIDKDGIRIGVVGIAAVIVDKVMPDWFSEGIRMTLGNEELPGYIRELRNEKDVDFIVVISHLGYPQDVKLASEVDDIDILLSAHTHNRLRRPSIVNDTIIIQSGCHGSFIGTLDIEISDGRIVDFSHELVKVDATIEPDKDIQKMVEEIMAPHRELLNEELAYVETPLHRYRVLESTMDTFLLESLLDLTGAQMAFSNGWRYGAPIPVRPITRNDLWNIIPVNPPVQTAKLSGAELWEMMEKNLERTFSRNPYNQMGGYVKRCLGLSLYFKIENGENQRIEQIFVGNERVDFEKEYDVCFVTSQGVRKEYGTHREKLDVTAIEALEKYLGKKQKVSVRLQNTINAI
jgi:S-sulfosulfanyl-L-cysteine sulfohydrolase